MEIEQRGYAYYERKGVIGMARGKPVIFSLYIIKKGETQPVAQFSDEDRARLGVRIGRALSEYYTQHPEEYATLTARPESQASLPSAPR